MHNLFAIQSQIMSERVPVTVEAIVNVPVAKAWKMWNEPEHITQWYFASPDWHAPSASIELRNGGKFVIRMEAKDGSFGFDMGGTYDTVVENEKLDGALGDGRKLTITFVAEGNATRITEVFEAEVQNSIEMQQNGWQAILNNFKTYAESH